MANPFGDKCFTHLSGPLLLSLVRGCPRDEVGSVRLPVFKKKKTASATDEDGSARLPYYKWQTNPAIAPGFGGSGSMLAPFLPKMNGVEG